MIRASAKKISKREGVEYILKTFPGSVNDSRLILLAWWKLFDGIEIPREVFRQVLAQGSHPETVLRRRRELLEVNKIEVSKDGSVSSSSRGPDDA